MPFGTLLLYKLKLGLSCFSKSCFPNRWFPIAAARPLSTCGDVLFHSGFLFVRGPRECGGVLNRLSSYRSADGCRGGDQHPRVISQRSRGRSALGFIGGHVGFSCNLRPVANPCSRCLARPQWEELHVEVSLQGQCRTQVLS